MLKILSFGVGVQSSTLLMLSEQGVLPRLDYAIFADTGAEPKQVYDYLEYMKSVTTIPIIVASEGNIYEDMIEKLEGRKSRYANPPFFLNNLEGKASRLRRYCTTDYKIDVVHKTIRREVLGLKPRQRVKKDTHIEQWIGISTDEIERLKQSRTPWITNRHPLIDLDMSRTDCLQWMKAHGYKTPPKSSCTFCPFHSDAMWADLKKDPETWKQVIEVDERIRNGFKDTNDGTQLFLHRSLKPIKDIEFTEDETNWFTEECEGMCGM